MDNDESAWIEDILDDQEKQLLEKIEKKIQARAEEMLAQKYADIDNDNALDFSQKHPEAMPPLHATDCPHEIKFTVVGEAHSIDDKGYIQDIKETFTKNYFIPIIVKEDYLNLMEKFFEVFQNKLTETCREVLTKPSGLNE